MATISPTTAIKPIRRRQIVRRSGIRADAGATSAPALP
jgi:hypothetical protein